MRMRHVELNRRTRKHSHVFQLNTAHPDIKRMLHTPMFRVPPLEQYFTVTRMLARACKVREPDRYGVVPWFDSASWTQNPHTNKPVSVMRVYQHVD